MEKKRVTVPLICHGHSRPVVDLFYSPITPDGFFLISASKDANPMLRNGETGDWVGTFQGHKGAVWSCCLDTNALLAATASADFSAKVWDAITGDVKHSFDHKHIVRSCAFSEDTHLLLTGGMEKLLRIYDMNRPEAPPREVDKSPGSVRTVAWLHSDKSILSSCSDMGGLRLWDIRSGQIVRTLETKSSVTSTEVSRDGRYITTCDGTTVKFWDANNFGLVKSHEMNFIVESASLEPKVGNKFVAGGEDMWVRVFDFHTGTEIACNKGHHGPVHCVRFSPGGESYASGSEDGTIRIWQTGLSTIEETEPTANTGVEVKPAEEQVSQKNIVVEGNSTKEIPNVPDKKNHSTTDIEEPAAKTGVEIKPAEVQVSQKNIVEGNATKEILNVPDKRNSSTIAIKEPAANTSAKVKPAEVQVSQKNAVVEGNATKEIPNVPDKRNPSTTAVKEPAANTGVMVKPAEVQVSQKNVVVEGNSTKGIPNVPDKRNPSTTAIKEPAANTSVEVKPAEVKVSQKNVVEGNGSKEIPNVSDKRNPSTTDIKETVANTGPSPSVVVKSS